MRLQHRLRPLKRKLEGQILVQYAATTLIAALVFGGLLGILNPAVDITNVRSLLTTLATVEGSVLAIVFSVTVVALQLVVTRYSARLTSLFIDDPIFRATFAIFVCAIAVNLVTVYLLPAQSGRVINAAVGVAFAFAGAATIALYRFIRLVIQRSSPDELITAMVEHELQPEEYLPERVEELRTATVHPLRPLYSTTSRALELAEYRTAKQGIDAFQTVLNDTFAYLCANYDLDDAQEFADAVSDVILTEYFPPIIEQAYEHEQHSLVSDATDTIEHIALNALHMGFTNVAEHAASGLGDIFDDAPLTWEGNRLRRPVSETLVRLTKVTAGTADYNTFLSVSHHLDHQYTVHLRRKPDKDVTRRLVNDYYGRDSVDIFEELVDRYVSELRNTEVNWVSPTDGRKWTLPSAAEPLRHFWRERTSFTQEILRYRVSEQEYPFVEGEIDAGWRECIETATDAGLDGLATLFCMTTIQVAYRVEQLEGKELGRWTNDLAHLRINYDPRIVDTAFALLQDGVQPESSQISVRPVSYDPTEPEQGFFDRLFSESKTDEEQFEKWVVEFQERVHDRADYIRNA